MTPLNIKDGKTAGKKNTSANTTDDKLGHLVTEISISNSCYNRLLSSISNLFSNLSSTARLEKN